MEIQVGSVSDDLLLADSDDTLRGVSGDDTLDASSGGGSNWLFGQEDDDLLLAGSNDILVGGTGNDRLFAGSGGALAGGEGEDQLWLVNGEFPATLNIVTDYTQGEDILGLGGLTAEELFSLTLIQREADTLVRIAGQNVALLRNIQADLLTENDFFVADEVVF